MLWTLPLLILAVILMWGWVSSGLIIKMGRTPLDVSPRSFGYDFEPFKVVTEDDVELDGWFVPSKVKSKSTIIILHGWGANRSDVIPSTIFLGEHYNLAYFDFRNHGRSGGGETSLTCLEMKDYIAVAKYLKNHKTSETRLMAVFGFSMGGSVAITGTTKLPDIKAVIAESPFSSFNETVVRFAGLFYGIPRPVVPLTLIFTRLRLGFDPEECAPIYHVAKLSPRPLLLIQAGEDARMPPSEGKALFDAAKEPRELWLVPNTDHGSIQDKLPEDYKKKILGFYQKWLKN